MTLYAELYAARGAEKGTPAVDTAVSWMLTDTLQLDIGTYRHVATEA